MISPVARRFGSGRGNAAYALPILLCLLVFVAPFAAFIADPPDACDDSVEGIFGCADPADASRGFDETSNSSRLLDHARGSGPPHRHEPSPRSLRAPPAR
jgi:hypothetical protein